jgi:hypothetical protein
MKKLKITKIENKRMAQLKMLPKYPPTTGTFDGTSSLWVLLIVGCSSKEEISLELFLE